MANILGKKSILVVDDYEGAGWLLLIFSGIAVIWLTMLKMEWRL